VAPAADAATTHQGLKVTAIRDDAACPAGIEISDRQIRDIEDRFIDRDPGHGGLCYTVLPRPRQAPEPEPAGPEPALAAALAALAGIPSLPELHSRTALDRAASREHQLTLRRGGNTGGYRGSGYGKLSEETILAAAACRIRLGMTWALLGRMLGVHESSISVPGNAAIPILEKHGITAPPARPRINTPGKLLAHAAATGITIPVPGPPPKPAKHANRTQTADSDTPETVNL
jgi:hypothetical protein